VSTWGSVTTLGGVVLGGALALGGGVYIERRRERRAVRLAGRLVYEELRENLQQVYRFKEPEEWGKINPRALEVEQQRQFLAGLDSTDAYETIVRGYSRLSDFAGHPGTSRAKALRAYDELLDETDGLPTLAEELAFDPDVIREHQDEDLAEVIGLLIEAMRVAAKLGKLGGDTIRRDITDPYEGLPDF